MSLVSRGPYNLKPGAGLMKQYSAMRNRKSGGQLECYSVEDLRASVPMKLMVNPYATRLVRNLLSLQKPRFHTFQSTLKAQGLIPSNLDLLIIFLRLI